VYPSAGSDRSIAAGHVHYLELDQFIGEDYLVTVHGPISSKAPLEAALRETKAVAARMDSRPLRPTSPFGLSYAIVSSIARRESHMVDEIAREVGLMEQRVIADVDEDPQKFLSELFAARHELLANLLSPICDRHRSAGRGVRRKVRVCFACGVQTCVWPCHSACAASSKAFSRSFSSARICFLSSLLPRVTAASTRASLSCAATTRRPL
jgi:hypothetical protein